MTPPGTTTGGRVAIYVITRDALALARQLRDGLSGEADVFYLARRVADDVGVMDGFLPITGSLRQTWREHFHHYRCHVPLFSVGAAVRLMAPCLDSKHRDPAVVAIDEFGRFAVALLSGHIGVANEWATRLARIIGATPVITTASDLHGTLAVDLLGRELGWKIDPETAACLTEVAALVVDHQPVALVQQACTPDPWPAGGTLPPGVSCHAEYDAAASACAAALIVSDRIDPRLQVTPMAGAPAPLAFHHPVVLYRPPTLVVGLGCDRGFPETSMHDNLLRVLGEHNLAAASVCMITSIDLKRDEPCLTALAARLCILFRTFGADALDDAPVSHPSARVKELVGTASVAEAAAVLGAGGGRLVVPKLVVHDAASGRNMTIAVARVAGEPGEPPPPERQVAPGSRGTLAVVGMGPGDAAQMTAAAQRAIGAADHVVGYKHYLDLIRPLLGDKAVTGFGMKREIERVAHAVQLAAAGVRVALVCSGDAGVYGMAGLCFEYLRHQDIPRAAMPAITVIPGVSAAHAAASLVGAPLMHDSATISLSDLLTPWDVIAKRIEAAAAGDFVITFYNPASQRRNWQLAEAVAIIRRHRPAATPVAIIRSAYRPAASQQLTDLTNLLQYDIDMATTVIIGNSQTYVYEGYMVTPRGYAARYFSDSQTDSGQHAGASGDGHGSTEGV